MKETIVALHADGEGPEDRLILAPAVGRYLHAPPVGTHLTPGAAAGVLRVLTTTRRVVVPRGGGGLVQEVLVEDRATAVDYGQPLLSLTLAAGGVALEGERQGEGGDTGDDSIPEGMVAVRAPTDGIFYRRPAPEEPAYVEVGDVVQRGKVLGLVEVMKCFNQVGYGAENDVPDQARVRRIVPEDAAEVKVGQPLFLLEPV